MECKREHGVGDAVLVQVSNPPKMECKRQYKRLRVIRVYLFLIHPKWNVNVDIRIDWNEYAARF